MPRRTLITAQEVAEALDISVETVLTYTRNRQIPSISSPEGAPRYELPNVLVALTAIAVNEKSPDYAVTKQDFTYQDYLQLPDEPGIRYEVLNGQLIKDPSPSFTHQWTVARLCTALDSYFVRTDPGGALVFSPLDVTFGESNVVQPDILYVAASQQHIIKNTRVNGAPTLVVEVISPASRRRDRVVKMQVYQRAGVENYWLVDPEKQIMDCFRLRGGTFVNVASARGDETLTHPNYPGLSIDLQELWWRS
ncbi:MAG: DNA-binding protein [Firmicutes bacterium]|nr:DNA-binding protein [Bacillota bacterium]